MKAVSVFIVRPKDLPPYFEQTNENTMGVMGLENGEAVEISFELMKQIYNLIKPLGVDRL